MNIHVDRNGERFGPYSLEEVNRYLAEGTLLPSDLGWYEGAENWAPLDQIEGIIAGAEPAPTSLSAASGMGGKGSKTVMIAVGSVVLIAAIAFGVMQLMKKDDEGTANKDENTPKTKQSGNTAKTKSPETTKTKQSENTSKPKPPDVDIFMAAGGGNLDALKQHIEAGTDLNQRSADGQKTTPLIAAAAFGKAGAAKALIEAKADLNLQNKDGNTALHTAAFMCHPEIVEALLKAGANKTIKSNVGATALDGAQAPWNQVKPVYDLLDGILYKPIGIPLDYNRIQQTRPKIAEMLR